METNILSGNHDPSGLENVDLELATQKYKQALTLHRLSMEIPINIPEEMSTLESARTMSDVGRVIGNKKQAESRTKTTHLI